MLNTKAKDPTDAIFGIKPDGTIAHFASAKCHMLVAGTTGSGKSVLLNEILVTAMCHSTPDELKNSRPKRVEFGRYKNCRSWWLIQLQIWMKLMIFEYLVILMHERYKLMEKGYNTSRYITNMPKKWIR